MTGWKAAVAMEANYLARCHNPTCQLSELQDAYIQRPGCYCSVGSGTDAAAVYLSTRCMWNYESG